MSANVELRIPGVPVAQPRQRTRVVKNGPATFAQNYTPSRHPVQEFKQAIRFAAAQQALGVIRGPVAIHWTAVFPRPKSLVWKRRPMPRQWHTSKPDRDNLDKAILDALVGVILVDDCQVCAGDTEKFIAAGDESPHVVITIVPLPGDPANG